MRQVKLIAASIIFTASLFTSSVSLKAQEQSKWQLAETVTIHSRILGEDRKLYIHFAPRNPASKGPYPVLYLLDGENHLPMVAGLADYIAKNTVYVPEMIIVGVDNNGYDRQRDLTPTHSYKQDPITPPDSSANSPTRTSGGGEKFIEFLAKEVTPYIDAHYPAAPFRILSGHSLGGLLAVHTLFSHPALFGAYIGVSPSLWWDDEYLINHLQEKLKPGSLENKKLFFSIAGEGDIFYRDLEHFNEILTQHPSAGLDFHYSKYLQETHTGSPARAYYDAFSYIFKDRIIPDTDTTANQVNLYYKKLSKTYGYEILPPEGTINGKGYQLLQQNKPQQALTFFLLNTSNYPTSANAFDSLGDGYMAAKDTAKAIAAYRQAVKLDPNQDYTRKKLIALENK